MKKRSRKSHLLEMKLEVLDRCDKGERNIDIQRAVGLSESTIRTIRNNAQSIRRSCLLYTSINNVE